MTPREVFSGKRAANTGPASIRAARRARAGFSLLELVMVIFILFILLTLFVGVGSKSFQSTATANCAKNLQNIFVAMKTYSLDNNGSFPVLTNAQTSEPVLSQMIPRYTTGTEYFTCPGTKANPLPDAQPFADRRISYAYYMGHTSQEGAGDALMSDAQVDTSTKYEGQQIFSQDGKKPGNNHNKFGGNIMFCDGNVQKSPALCSFNLTNGPNIVLLNPKP